MNQEHDLTKIRELIGIYENTNDARTRLRAESQICRLEQRLTGSNGIVYGNNGAYTASVEEYKGFRIPHLKKVLSTDDLALIASTLNLTSDRFDISSIGFVPGINGREKLGIYFDKDKLDNSSSRPLFFSDY